jgi:hypothetical protein
VLTEHMIVTCAGGALSHIKALDLVMEDLVFHVVMEILIFIC